MIIELDKVKVLQLLKDFNMLTGIRICLFDVNFQEILSFPNERPSYCAKIRSDEKGQQKCLDCDIKALSVCEKSKALHIYNCHAGFVEAVCPIQYDRKTLGYLMFGHVRKKTPAFIQAAAKIMESCACYIYLSRLFKLKESNLEKRINDYLLKNISSTELKVDKLCKEFQISRVALYAFFKQTYSCSPATYIKKLRLQQACNLLKKTDKTITFISSEVGFDNYNYFSKQFKKEFLISPGKFRK